MIDTHCHLDAERFDPDRPQVLARAREAGVRAIVVPGVWPRSWDALRDYAAQNPGVFAAAGVHPQVLPELAPSDDDRHLADLDAQLARGGWIGVGECGLDGPTAVAGVPMDRQLRILQAHLALARKHRLPILAHAFHAHSEMQRLLEHEGLPEAGLILHSYSGGAQLVEVFARLGCYFGMAGPVTYAKARRPVESVKAIPFDRLLLETDAPDQTPSPHRQTRNEPGFLPHIAQAIAEARAISLDALVSQTDANALRLFGLSLGYPTAV